MQEILLDCGHARHVDGPQAEAIQAGAIDHAYCYVCADIRHVAVLTPES